MLATNVKKTNKGKKYVKKHDIDLVYADKAEYFNTWFTANSQELIDYLIVRRGFDDDAFNEAYLNMYENILFKGTEPEDYKSYYMTAYYTLVKSRLIYGNRFCELAPNYEKEDFDIIEFDEVETKRRKLENDILDYVYQEYDIRKFEIFKMYINLKPAVNYGVLARITKLKYHVIQSTVSEILRDVRSNNQFVTQRGETV